MAIVMTVSALMAATVDSAGPSSPGTLCFSALQTVPPLWCHSAEGLSCLRCAGLFQSKRHVSRIQWMALTQQRLCHAPAGVFDAVGAARPCVCGFVLAQIGGAVA